MWEAICMTLLATAGNNIGKVLQKKGTVILPPLSFKFKVIRAYVSNRLWIIGFLMDIFGALLMLKALSEAPVRSFSTLIPFPVLLGAFFVISAAVSV
ncbi:hypothetical protein Taro_034941 [Colocasia esculenta]|uniref:Uncharacterized protein n=1 Tax=Colocasia esculenta TaxID=4460 RepID=A0A843VXQ8_COLES|nr:hypothetical protein [Colocasia esculenta]